MDPVEIFRGHHISNFEKKIREITDYLGQQNIWYKRFLGQKLFLVQKKLLVKKFRFGPDIS